MIYTDAAYWTGELSVKLFGEQSADELSRSDRGGVISPPGGLSLKK